jgi:malate:Na+ symporter
VALMVPAALIGNVVAIVSSGLLARLGEKRPALSGNGMLVRTGDDQELMAQRGPEQPISLSLLGAGIMLSCSFLILGGLLAPLTGIPGSIMMIICAVILKVAKILPSELETGAYQINRFMWTNLTLAPVSVTWERSASAAALAAVRLLPHDRCWRSRPGS